MLTSAAQSSPDNQAASPLDRVLPLLRCPATGSALTHQGDRLVSADEPDTSYPVQPNGVPLFAAIPKTEDSIRQQAHYDRVAAAYIANLNYPHTIVYQQSLDDAVTEAVADQPLGTTLEVCCGRGEAFALFADQIETGIGVDISAQMLASAREHHDPARFTFLQGDATNLPVADSSIDTVFMLGGVHHVNDRQTLFNEIARVLKPGGRFICREPLDDFWLWRGIRKIIYRLSPALDDQTERPLVHEETVPPLEQAGLTVSHWKTYGFFGFCIFMNSDVLVFNRLFRFIPGIRAITRAAVKLDDLTIRAPGMSRAGLQLVAVATKPVDKK